jgi:pimeloyl-ACP methyl ester carboxylesterase
MPILYLHGAIGSPRWRTPALDAVITSLGVRYIVVDRPGFGGSDPAPARTVADFAGDVEQLADAIGLDRFAVVGVSAGAPYAFACAWAMPERVTATAAVSSLPAPRANASGVRGRYRLPLIAFGAPGVGPRSPAPRCARLGCVARRRRGRWWRTSWCAADRGGSSRPRSGAGWTSGTRGATGSCRSITRCASRRRFPPRGR